MSRTIAWTVAITLTALGALAVQACTVSGPDDLGKVEKAVRLRFPGVTQMSTGELAAELDGPGPAPVLLDGREAEEYEVSHLPGARLATDEEMALKALEGVPKDRPVVVYCSVGYRSSSLASELEDAGYENVANLEGSIFAWAREGRPIVKPDGSPASEVHPYDDTWGKLLPEELRAEIED